ncbi:MAG: PAS domain-containing protein, partial [Planctomycetales bacterium]|nr:PAS domain-containing protein [Planctomycetales bacterium]
MKPFSAESGANVNVESVLAQLARERRQRAVLEAQLDRRYASIAGQHAGEYLVYTTDRAGNVTYVSPSVERLFGYPVDALIGRNWRDMAYEGTRSYAIAEEEEMELLTGAESPARLITMRRADGRPVVLEVMARPLCNEDGEVIGIEGVCRESRSLDPDEVELRLTRGELEKEVQRRTAELEYRLEFEKLLVSLSTGFINLPSDRIDDRLCDALRRIGEFTKVNRCFIYQLDPGGQTASLTHEWCDPDTPRIQSKMQAVPLTGFEWEVRQLAAGNALIFEDTAHLPPEATGIGPFYRQLGIRSALNVPLLASGEFRGMLGLSLMSGPRDWHEDSVALVKVLGEVLVNALERHRAKAALERSEARLREIVRDQTEMILRWTPDGRCTFVNDAVCRFHETSAEELIGSEIVLPIHEEDRLRVREKIENLTVDKPVEVD